MKRYFSELQWLPAEQHSDYHFPTSTHKAIKCLLLTYINNNTLTQLNCSTETLELPIQVHKSIFHSPLATTVSKSGTGSMWNLALSASKRLLPQLHSLNVMTGVLFWPVSCVYIWQLWQWVINTVSNKNVIILGTLFPLRWHVCDEALAQDVLIQQ